MMGKALAASASILILTAIACFVASVIATRAALGWLSKRRFLDNPNARSSHSAPTPTGGGIGFMAVILVALLVTYSVEQYPPFWLLTGTVIIVAVSFVDDLRPVPSSVRLLFQTAAILALLASLPVDTVIINAGLPDWLDRALAGLAWLWFINLFNFMDGIDGIAAGESVIVAVGLVGLALLNAVFGSASIPAVIVAAAAAGFLLLNWYPSRLFMGDSGSTGLGFVIGWLLIEAAGAGLLAAALILPMFFLVDATSTLFARAIRRRPLARAHRDHAYQAAVDRGLSQRFVAASVGVLGLALIGLAWLSPSAPVATTATALAVSSGLVAWFRCGGNAHSDGASAP